MELDVKQSVWEQMQRLRRVNIKPVCVVVSRDVMYMMKEMDTGSANPYSPYFLRAAVNVSLDTFMGLPVGVVDAGDDVKGYIQVGGMV